MSARQDFCEEQAERCYALAEEADSREMYEFFVETGLSWLRDAEEEAAREFWREVNEDLCLN